MTLHKILKSGPVEGLTMKQIAAILISFLVATASAAYAQSLGDLAKKEKERREAVKANAKVITNDQTTNYRGGSVTTGTMPMGPSQQESPKEESAATEASSESAKAASDEPVDFQGRPESYWRKTMADARQNIKDLENEANVLILKLSDLQTQFYREDDGFRQQSIQKDIQKTLYEQDLNKTNLSKAKEALDDLEKEGRKSGALPGWLAAK